jgi:hypothetical protein
MNAEIEVLELLRTACASLRVSRKRPELWEAAAKQEKILMAQIEKAKTDAEPLLQAAGAHAGAVH